MYHHLLNTGFFQFFERATRLDGPLMIEQRIARHDHKMGRTYICFIWVNRGVENLEHTITYYAEENLSPIQERTILDTLISRATVYERAAQLFGMTVQRIPTVISTHQNDIAA